MRTWLVSSDALGALVLIVSAAFACSPAQVAEAPLADAGGDAGPHEGGATDEASTEGGLFEGGASPEDSGAVYACNRNAQRVLPSEPGRVFSDPRVFALRLWLQWHGQ